MKIKKHIPYIIIIALLIVIIIALCIILIKMQQSTSTGVAPYVESPTTQTPTESEESQDIQIPTSGNDTIITTNTKTTLRFVNEYDTSFFTKSKNLLIMFGSWCPNCKEEIAEIEKILKYYENSKNVEIVLIAHEYQNTITDLKSLVENDADFKDEEVLIDLNRIIRKTIDPEASTIPISYVVDKKGNILNSYDSSLTLDKAIEMLK